MIKPLHPTLKACHCGFVGTRTQLYKHFKLAATELGSVEYFRLHGEVPLNVDDPRVEHVLNFLRATARV